MNWLLVFAGGGLGACCRYGLALMLPPAVLAEGHFPWATFLANLLACSVLGLGLAFVARDQLPRAGQLLLITGFCGGFSTFSTFALELTDLLQQGYGVVAFTYLFASLLGGTLSILAVVYLTGTVAG
ncbi:fluoride efflux transporter FluC [Lewinella sp. IMCC34183]|uniref:fluoride efflux transporter FluC n=1 Tax=Lewinella sp. IMCC34183 TaxID=2248762 RepID=UPI000E255B2B|nr:CrcB family protein [Lewinella sp. IMCC34183]